MNKVVRLQFIGSDDAVKIIEEFLQAELATRDARFTLSEQRYRSRRTPDAVRTYAEIELPFYLFDGEVAE